jgi:hypothetical protein
LLLCLYCPVSHWGRRHHVAPGIGRVLLLPEGCDWPAAGLCSQPAQRGPAVLWHCPAAPCQDISCLWYRRVVGRLGTNPCRQASNSQTTSNSLARSVLKSTSAALATSNCGAPLFALNGVRQALILGREKSCRPSRAGAMPALGSWAIRVMGSSARRSHCRSPTFGLRSPLKRATL